MGVFCLFGYYFIGYLNVGNGWFVGCVVIVGK